MKVIIAGSRTILEYKFIKTAVNNARMFDIVVTEIVSGTANGIDKLGEKYGLDNNLKIKRFPANWDLYGKSAGYIRNKQMAEYADASIIVWDGISKGTSHMIKLCEDYNLTCYVLKV